MSTDSKQKSKMNKFRPTFKGVLGGIMSMKAPPKMESEVEETLRTDHFQVCKVGMLMLISVSMLMFK